MCFQIILYVFALFTCEPDKVVHTDFFFTASHIAIV